MPQQTLLPAQRVLGAALLVLVLARCGSGGEPPNGAANLAPASGDGQNAPVGSAVPVPPSVVVTDEAGAPVAGVRVTFSVGSGGGSVVGGSPTTNASGVATVGDWVLGSFVGGNTLQAMVVGVGSITFTATATAGAPAAVTAQSVTSQVGLPGTPVAAPPSVKVTDAFGNGIPGVAVIFSVNSGGGSLTGGSATTSASGVATVGSWTLGSAAGPNVLLATVQAAGISGNPVTFTANSAQTEYAISLRLLGTMTGTQNQAFQNARIRLEQLIIGDIPDFPVSKSAGACGVSEPAMNETVDDLVIFAEIAVIDGPGNILGRAGPCVIRPGGQLPVVGIMQFDVADMAALEAAGRLQAVILHEMLHVVGFGSIWTLKGLLLGGGGTDPTFTGGATLAAFNSIGGNQYLGAKVPVENTGGPGTRDSHWRETVFKTELMTGFINNGLNPLSVVTASSLQDMGYVVNPSQVDAFTISPPFVAPPFAAKAAVAVMVDDIWRGPLFEVDSTGRPRRIIRP